MIARASQSAAIAQINQSKLARQSYARSRPRKRAARLFNSLRRAYALIMRMDTCAHACVKFVKGAPAVSLFRREKMRKRSNCKIIKLKDTKRGENMETKSRFLRNVMFL